jgi:protein-S-isoprenylcysteine O-methyltransferase Ste14
MKPRLSPDSYLVILIALSLALHFYYPVTGVIYFPATMVGIIVSVTGLVVSTVANVSLLKHRTSTKPFEKPSELIETEIFRYSRNPVYVGMLLVLTGIDVYLGSATALAVPLVFFLILNTAIIPSEERKLQEVFGERYSAYKRSVRRWI